MTKCTDSEIQWNYGYKYATTFVICQFIFNKDTYKSYTNYTVVITICLSLRNTHISNDNGSFTFHVDVFLLCHYLDFYRNWLYMWAKWWVSYKKQELFTLREHLCSFPVFGAAYPVRFVVFLCFVCLRPSSCVPNVVSDSVLSILDWPFAFLWRLFTRN